MIGVLRTDRHRHKEDARNRQTHRRHHATAEADWSNAATSQETPGEPAPPEAKRKARADCGAFEGSVALPALSGWPV